MNMINKNITITEQQANWIRSQVESGNFETDNDLVQEALLEKQKRSEEIEAIRKKLINAEQSGIVDKTPAEILAEFKERARQDGLL